MTPKGDQFLITSEQRIDELDNKLHELHVQGVPKFGPKRYGRWEGERDALRNERNTLIKERTAYLTDRLAEKFGFDPTKPIPWDTKRPLLVKELIELKATDDDICNVLRISSCAHYFRKLGLTTSRVPVRETPEYASLRKFGLFQLLDILPDHVAIAQARWNRDKLIFRMHEEHNLTFTKLAELTGISKTRVSQMFHRAEFKKRWKERQAENDEENEDESPYNTRSPLERYLSEDKLDFQNIIRVTHKPVPTKRPTICSKCGQRLPDPNVNPMG